MGKKELFQLFDKTYEIELQYNPNCTREEFAEILRKPIEKCSSKSMWRRIGETICGVIFRVDKRPDK